MRPILLIAEFADEARTLLDGLGVDDESTEVVAIGLQPEAVEVFATGGLAVTDTLRWLSAEAHRRVAHGAVRLASKWYKPLETKWPDRLLPQGYSIGEDAEFVAGLWFTHVAFLIEIVEAAIDDLKPLEVRCVNTPRSPVTTPFIDAEERYLADVVGECCRRRGIAVNRRDRKTPVEPTHNATFSAARAALGRLGLAGMTGMAVASLGARVKSSWARVGSPPSTRRVAFWGAPPPRDLLVAELKRRSVEVVALTPHRPRSALMSPVRSVSVGDYVDSGPPELLSPPPAAALAKMLEPLRYNTVAVGDMFTPRAEYYLTRASESVRVLDATRAFIRSESPQVLVVREHINSSMQWALHAFREAGLPAVLIPHGYQPIDADCAVVIQAYGPLLRLRTDYYLAPGAMYQDFYQAFEGVSRQRVIVTGAYDWALGTDNPARRAQVLRRLGLRADRFTVLYANSGTGRGRCRAYTEETLDEILESSRAVSNAIAASPDLQLMLRPHPASPRAVQAAAAAASALENVAETSDISFEDCLTASDAVITYASTAGVQALASGRPLLVYNPRGRLNNLSPMLTDRTLSEHKPGILIEDAADIAPTLRHIRDSAEYRDQLKRVRDVWVPQLHRDQTGAVERIAEALLTIAAGQSWAGDDTAATDGAHRPRSAALSNSV